MARVKLFKVLDNLTTRRFIIGWNRYFEKCSMSNLLDKFRLGKFMIFSIKDSISSNHNDNYLKKYKKKRKYQIFKNKIRTEVKDARSALSFSEKITNIFLL